MTVEILWINNIFGHRNICVQCVRLIWIGLKIKISKLSDAIEPNNIVQTLVTAFLIILNLRISFFIARNPVIKSTLLLSRIRIFTLLQAPLCVTIRLFRQNLIIEPFFCSKLNHRSSGQDLNQR